jgi:uncharacterized damage-inducible protein DinB
MNGKEVLKRQYALLYRTVGANLSGLTAEDSLRQPAPGGNCANWILGHLVGAHNQVMRLMGEEPVWEDESLERAGSHPITDPTEGLDWDTLRDRFLESEERCLAAVDRMTEEQLGEGGFSDPFGADCTRGELLNLLAFHQAYHAGQLGIARRLAGHAGVIGAPGAQPA